MPAYLIAQINVTNEDSYKEYLAKVTPTVEKYGGEYIIRAGKFKTVLGNWDYKRNVVIEFPSLEKAKEFYNCPEYQPIKKIRLDNAENNLIIKLQYSCGKLV